MRKKGVECQHCRKYFSIGMRGRGRSYCTRKCEMEHRKKYHIYQRGNTNPKEEIKALQGKELK